MRHGRLAVFIGSLLACGLVVGCSGDEKVGGAQRAVILNQTVARIAADALSDAPSADYRVARERVSGRLTEAQRTRARSVSLSAGGGGAVVLDADIQRARRAAAAELNTTLDAAKEADAASAEQALAALLAEVQRLNAAAATCGALAGAKADDCAIALIIIEVRRSEAASVTVDASVPTDAVTSDAGDASVTPLGWLECGSRDIAGATLVTGTLMGDVSWSGSVLVKGDVYMYAGKLTVAPGTRVLMDVDSHLYIGWNGNVATVVADGSPAAPITFCGVRGDAGFWEAVELGREVTSDSVLRNVLFADGSGEEFALVLDADVLVDNVQVRNAENHGVRAADFKAGSRSLSVQGAGKAPVALTAAAAATNFPLGGRFVANAENLARVRFTSIEADTVLHNLSIPYLQEQDVYHYGNKLTIEAGVEYRLQPDGMLWLGWNAGDGELHVDGTAAAPVVFRGTQETAGSWRGISIGTAITSNSNLTHTVLRHGGGGTSPALDLRSPVKLDHVTLTDNGLGMTVTRRGFGTGSTGLTITKTGGRPLTIDPNAVGSLPLGGSYTGNMVDQIAVETTGLLDTSVTFHKAGVPYYFASGVLNTSGAMLTLAPGTEFVMGADTAWEIGWNSNPVVLIANGSAAEPIRFRGADVTPGYWRGIELGRGVSSNSQLNQLTIENAGGGTGAALELNVALPVTSSRFIASAGFGIRRPMGATIDYVLGNTFTDVALGPVGDL